MSWVILTCLLASSASLHVEGQAVLPREVYVTVADVGDGPYDREDADRAARRVRAFLQATGYRLARVETEISDGDLYIRVDEGRLEKIVVPDEGALAALAVRAMLDLPKKVFNRYVLDRELRRLERDFGLEFAGYEIVPTESRTGSVLDLGLEGGDGLGFFEPRARYRLELRLTTRDMPRGFGVGVRFRDPDGLVTTLRYRFGGLFTDEDRFDTEAGLGVRPQDLFNRETERRLVSRGEVGLRYFSVPIIEGFRLHLGANAYWANRQRIDLEIDSYDMLETQLTAGLRYHNPPGIQFSIGLGGAYLYVIRAERGDASLEVPDDARQLRPMLDTRFEVAFGHSQTAYRHYIELGGAVFGVQDVAGLFDGSYEKRFPIGWDELIVRLEVSGRWGAVPYPRERALGRHLTAIFGNRPFPETAAALKVEYRFSLVRDLLHFGAFHDGAVYHVPPRPTRERHTGFANSFGVGLYGLVLDAFSFGAVVAHGFRTDGPQETGVSLSLQQLF